MINAVLKHIQSASQPSVAVKHFGVDGKGFPLLIILYTLYWILNTPIASAATISVLPQGTEVGVGQTSLVELWLDTEGETVNALSFVLAFDPQFVSVESVSTGGSVFSLFPVPPLVLNERGVVELSAGAPGGFAGQGLVANILLRGLRVGTAALSITSSQALKHSPTAEPISLRVLGSSLQVATPETGEIVITSKDHAEESVWYNVPFIRMSWPVRPGASYSYVLSRSPNEEPDEVPDEPTGEIKLSISEDGVFYFHLRECRAGTCGPTVTRRAMKDTTPPERLELAVGAASGVLEGKVFLSFTASDATSGVAHYEVWEEAVGETWERVMSPYVLQDQAHQGVVRVRAYDTAGNYREEILSPLAPEPWYRSEVVFWGILVVGLAALGVTIFVKRRGQAGPAPQANQSSTPPLP